MTQSFVRQGVNIVCSNMTISSPRKLGLDPEKKSVETQGITIYSEDPVPLLNILDKKLDACFECKMPKKLWGGLAAFFAGIAIAAIVVAILILAPYSIPAILAIASISLEGALITSVVATAAYGFASLYEVYAVSHACDACLEGDWIEFHKTVLIEDQPALLNKSQLLCPTGGTLDIIFDDELALQAAQLISSANNSEVKAHLLSKGIAGFLTFICSGVLGTVISAAIEYYNTTEIDDRKSNQNSSVLKDAGVAVLEHNVSAATEAVLTVPVVNSSVIWKSFGKNCLNKASIFGTIITFAVDLVSNQIEKSYEDDAKVASEEKNREDEEKGNNIRIIAITQ